MKIVCFGDSLTEGYQSSCAFQEEEFTPYGKFLQAWLGNQGSVRICGVCGETTQDMKGRFERDVLALQPDYVIILGGTNDLGWGMLPQAVLANLIEMFRRARLHGIIPIAVTVPSIGGVSQSGIDAGAYSGGIQIRTVLNQALQDYCAREQIPCVDFFTATSNPLTHELDSRYSEDGLHLTTVGYRRLADLLWDKVFHSRFPNRSDSP